MGLGRQMCVTGDGFLEKTPALVLIPVLCVLSVTMGTSLSYTYPLLWILQHTSYSKIRAKNKPPFLICFCQIFNNQCKLEYVWHLFSHYPFPSDSSIFLSFLVLEIFIHWYFELCTSLGLPSIFVFSLHF